MVLPGHQQPPHQNIEHLTLIECTGVLTTEIAANPLEVAQKCVEENLVPPSLVGSILSQAEDNRTNSSKLVLMITDKVGVFPEYFCVLLRILHSFGCFESLCRRVEAKYEEKRRNALSDESRVGKVK